jgi:hypothetical protein
MANAATSMRGEAFYWVGDNIGEFADPRGPSASELQWMFFKAHFLNRECSAVTETVRPGKTLFQIACSISDLGQNARGESLGPALDEPHRCLRIASSGHFASITS